MDKRTKYALLGIITESLTQVPTNLNIALSAQFAAGLAEVLIPKLNEFYGQKPDAPKEPSVRIQGGGGERRRAAAEKLPEVSVINKEPADNEETAPLPEAPDDVAPEPENLGALITWAEKPVDESKYYCVRYSNPCTTLKGKSGACAQTESIWHKIGSKNPDDFLIVDYEAKTIEDLKLYFDAKIAAGAQYDKQYVDKVNQAIEDINANCKATRAANKAKVEGIMGQPESEKKPLLTNREQEFYDKYWGSDKTAAEISEDGGFSIQSVKFYRSVIKKKLAMK